MAQIISQVLHRRSHPRTNEKEKKNSKEKVPWSLWEANIVKYREMAGTCSSGSQFEHRSIMKYLQWHINKSLPCNTWFRGQKIKTAANIIRLSLFNILSLWLVINTSITNALSHLWEMLWIVRDAKIWHCLQ